MKLTWVLGVSLLTACGMPQFLTVSIYDSPERVVRLQAIPGVNHGKGYSHPVVLSKDQMAKVLEGLYVEESTVALPFSTGSGDSTSQRVFNDQEVEFFAPHLIKGLSMATSEEVVTFFETAEVSSLHRLTTSGGVYVKDNELHILLSNYAVKTNIWQDADAYQAPFRLRPLEPIDPQPGRLTFKPQHVMVQSAETGLPETFGAKPWHAAVFFQKLTK